MFSIIHCHIRMLYQAFNIFPVLRKHRNPYARRDEYFMPAYRQRLREGVENTIGHPGNILAATYLRQEDRKFIPTEPRHLFIALNSFKPRYGVARPNTVTQ